MNYKQHPLSAAFPLPTPAEFEALKHDIAAVGQRHPIIIFDGMVLDGWTRYRAKLELEQEPIFAQYEGDDPAGYVLSSNLHRRHLSASQRAGAIVACNDWRSNGERGPEKLCKIAELPQTSAQMAETAQVSTRTIDSAKAAQSAGLSQPVRDGKMTVSAAAELARKIPEVVAKIVRGEVTPTEAKAELQAKVKRELPNVAAPDLNAELDALHAELMDMRAELMELRAASHDEQLRAQARDEIQGLREALELEQRLHVALKAQASAQDDRLNDWKRRCAGLEKQLERRERGE